MALHQYIGARYVPKFYENSVNPDICEWEINVTYEPLTVVTVDNDHCYISKMTVPDNIGTPADNSHYWLEIGNENAYIRELQEDVAEIREDISDIEGNITTMQGSISTLEDEVPQRNKRNIICIGDSYGQFIDGSTRSWISYLKDFIQNVDKFYYNALGGAGFLADYYGAGTYKSFLTLLQELETSITNKEDITDVVFCGGYNDYTGGYNYLSNLGTVFQSIKQYVNTTYPNAKIYIGFIGHSTDATICQGLAEVYLNYRVQCENSGLIYLSGSEKVLKYDGQMNTAETSPAIHPNDLGSIDLGSSIAQLLCGKEISLYTPSFGFSAGSNLFTSGLLMTSGSDNNTIWLKANRAQLNLTTPTAVTLGQSFSLAFLNISSGVAIHVFDDVRVAIHCIMIDENGGFHDVNGQLRLHDNILYIDCSKIESNAWATFNLASIVLDGFEMNVNRHAC